MPISNDESSDIKKLAGADDTVADVVTDGFGVKRLAIDLQSTSPNDFKSKVSSDDTTGNYLDNKVVSGSSRLSKTVLNDGANESLQLDVVEANIVHQNISGAGSNTHAQIDSHIANTSNPHATTATQVGADPVGSAAAAQAFSIQRANHTGTQTSSTISDFTEASQDATASLLVAGSNITLNYNDAANSLTISSSSGASSSGTAGHVQYSNGSGGFSSDTNQFFWDATNNRLGLGTASPSTGLQVVGSDITLDTTKSLTATSINGTNYVVPNDGSDAAVQIATGGYLSVKDGIGTVNARLGSTTAGSSYINTPLGVGNTGAVASAQLQVDSTTRGFLVPRMTTVQRDAIASPANGLQIYNTTVDELEYYNGTDWIVCGIPSSGSVYETTNTATTSSTFSLISGMTVTPPQAGTYRFTFQCDATLASDTSADITAYVNGIEFPEYRSALAIATSGAGNGSYTIPVCIEGGFEVNGSQALEIRFRENGSGTLTIGRRLLGYFPISR